MIPAYVTPEYMAALVLRSGKGTGKPGDCCVVQELRRWHDVDPSIDLTPDGESAPIYKMLIGLNDASPRTREMVRSRMTQLVGTGRSPEIEHARSLMALDWYLRTWLPAWFDLTESLAPHAKALRAMEQITDSNARDAGKVVNAARAAARDAAGEAAGAAAGAAAWAAARDAAWAAAWDAAGAAAMEAAGAAASAAAWDAAWAAARDAAGAATWAAVGAAAKAKLALTVERLQDSAIDLLDRMLALGGE